MTDHESGHNFDDESIYATALSEIQSGELRQGVWAKAYAESDGDEIKSKALYIRLRVQQEKERVLLDESTGIKNSNINSAAIESNKSNESPVNKNDITDVHTSSNSGSSSAVNQLDLHSLANPWPRFFARLFDICWEVLLVSFVLGSVLGQYSAGFSEWINKPGASQLFVISCLPIAMILDALLYGLFENTPGKAWLGLGVRTMDGKPLSFASYFARNFSMWASGLAFGIPLINLITMAIQFRRLNKDRATFYDRSLGFQVITTPVGSIRKAIFGITFSGMCFVMMLLNSMGQSAHYSEQGAQHLEQSAQHLEQSTQHVRKDLEQIKTDLVAMYASNAPRDVMEQYLAPKGFTLDSFIQTYEAYRRGLGNILRDQGNTFLAENKNKDGVVTLASGLQYKVIKAGKGRSPKVSDTVVTHYRGSLIDGKVFDSSYERGEPVAFPVNGVIPGWTEALQKMKVGDKWQLFIPSNLAYGENGSGPIGPNSVLVFEIELLEIKA